MAIGIYSVCTARDIRNAIALARHTIRAGKQEILGDVPGFKFKEGSLKRALEKCREEGVEDTLEYTYRFITSMAWLSQEVTNRDDLHFNKEKK